jgi:hypothetical protein
MSARDDERGRRAIEPIFTVSDDELLADLSWPGLPPGRWHVGAPVAETKHIDALIEHVETMRRAA